jgi:hypothetical protein
MYKMDLTDDPEEFCKFVGLDYNKFNSLSTVNEIYDYIKSCKFYDDSIFSTSNLEKQRPFFTNFLKYIGVDTIGGNKKVYKNLQLDSIKYFNKEDEYNKLLKELAIKKEIKEKINGKYLLDIGIEPKKIGPIMKIFKEKYETEFILNNTTETLMDKIKEINNNIKN